MKTNGHHGDVVTPNSHPSQNNQVSFNGSFMYSAPILAQVNRGCNEGLCGAKAMLGVFVKLSATISHYPKNKPLKVYNFIFICSYLHVYG